MWQDSVNSSVFWFLPTRSAQGRHVLQLSEGSQHAGISYTEAPQGSWWSHQDLAALTGVADEEWWGGRLSWDRSTSPSVVQRQPLGSRAKRVWCVILCRQGEQAGQSIPPHSGDQLTYRLPPRHQTQLWLPPCRKLSPNNYDNPNWHEKALN